MPEQLLSEEEIRTIFQVSVDSFGINHTHDFACQTWRGKNWPESCNCTLREREPDAYRQ